ncbi:MAG: HAD family phosphatase [Thermoleophilia bacterium]|nr:HAD family phosphatase [Thermoleophilia bacterium]
MGRVRALLFDFNGTLSDDEPLLCAVYRDLFAEYGRPLSEEEYYAHLAGLAEAALLARWLDLEGEALEQAAGQRIARYQELASDGSTVLAHTREAVAYAATRVPLAIVSGAVRREIEPVVAAAGLAGLFAELVAADDVSHGKPHPEGYLRALDLLGLADDPANVVAFEDTEVGVAAAKDAGLVCFAMATTLPPGRLGRADRIVPRIDLALVREVLG